MSKTTKKVMNGVRRRLTRLIGLEVCACGYAENIRRADAARDRLEEYLEQEIEALVAKAGEV